MLLAGCGSSPDRDAALFESTTTTGFLDLDSGFEDRLVATTSASLIQPSGLGLHAELVGEEREEDAVFAIGGVSYHTEHLVPKVRLGTSSENDGILPEFYAEAGVTYISDPEDGFTITPVATYRSYRNSAEESGLGVAGTRYFSASGDFLWIGQTFGRVTLAAPGDNVGVAGGGSLAYSRYATWSLGLLVEAGSGGYDSVLGAGRVDNDFVSARPFASHRLSDNVELFGRLEYYDTDNYIAQGVFVGVKFSAPIRNGAGGPV